VGARGRVINADPLVPLARNVRLDTHMAKTLTGDKASGMCAESDAGVQRPGGCFTCRHLAHRLGVDAAVWCGRPGMEHIRWQADRGCKFWQREPGADFDAD